MTIVPDFRAALRSIKRTPVSSAAVALTLALGIGLNTAIFSVVHAVLLQPLAYDQPDRLVIVQSERRADDRTNLGVTGVDFRNIQRDSKSFESIEAVTTIRQNLTGIETAEQIQVGWVSNGFFDVFRTQPFIGRYFAPDEQPGSVVLSFGVWQRAFGGNDAAVGQTVRLDAQAYTVIGVLPPSFQLHASASALDIDLWKNPDNWWQNGDPWSTQNIGFGFQLIGRLHDGVTPEQVETELENFATALRGEVAAYDAADYHLTATPLAERVTSGARSTLLLLLGAVSLVFLIACGNVMNLMLVRAESRRRELATRVALGADRGKVVRLLLTEGTTLALAGGALGLGIAVIGTKMLALFGPQDVPRLDEVGINTPVLLFGLGITLVSVVAFGLVPALRAARRDVYANLSVRGAAGRRRHRLSGGLVIAQLGVSLMLLIGAGLLTRSLTQLNEVDPGFDHEGLFTFAVSVPGARYTWPEQTNLFFLELEERIEALPGVESANVVWPLPMSGANWPGRYEGGSVEAGERAATGYRLVTPDYFETVGTRLLEGRDFGRGDPKTTVIVSENIAQRAWPGQSAVGRRIRANPWGGGMVDFEVIGVVEDVQFEDLREPAGQSIYFDSEGWAWSDWEVNYAVRVTGDANAVIQPIRAEIAAMDSEIPMAMTQTMEQYIDERLAAHHFALLLIGTFAAVAAALAAIGLYGVISHAVSLRGREIGIRIALGSDNGGVIRLILAQGLRVIVPGIGLGAAGAALLTRVLGSYLFGVTATDPTTFALLSAGLAAVAIAASLIPALRAATLDPMVVLRSE